MYAVIQTGGKQYRVTENDVLRVEKLDAGAGETVTFECLAIGEGEGLTIGTPLVSGASVTATIIGQRRRLGNPTKKDANGKQVRYVPETDDNGELVLDDDGNSVPKLFDFGLGKKVIVFKFKRRKNYKRLNGHRQPFTELRITGISA